MSNDFLKVLATGFVVGLAAVSEADKLTKQARVDAATAHINEQPHEATYCDLCIQPSGEKETYPCDCCKTEINNWTVTKDVFDRKYIICTRCSIKECGRFTNCK